MIVIIIIIIGNHIGLVTTKSNISAKSSINLLAITHLGNLFFMPIFYSVINLFFLKKERSKIEKIIALNPMEKKCVNLFTPKVARHTYFNRFGG